MLWLTLPWQHFNLHILSISFEVFLAADSLINVQITQLVHFWGQCKSKVGEILKSLRLEKGMRFARVGTKSCKLFSRDVLHCKIILNLWT